MNKFILSAAVALALPAVAFGEIVNPDSTGFQFTDVELVKTSRAHAGASLATLTLKMKFFAQKAKKSISLKCL